MNKFALLLCLLISVLCSSAQHTHYYTQSVGNIYTLSTWGSSPDGSGPSPSSFSMNNAIFHFRNRPSFNLFAAGNFIVSGINSGIVIGNGVSPTTLTVPIGYTLSADSIFIDSASQLTNSGSVNWNKSHFSYYSTVVYNDTNTFQLVRGGEYGRLNLYGGSTTRFWPDTRTKRLTGNVVVSNRLFLSSLVYCDSFAVTLGLSSVQPGTLTYDLITPYGGIIGKFFRWMPMGPIGFNQGFFPMVSINRKFNFLTITTIQDPMFGGLVSVEYLNYWPGNFGLPIYDSASVIPLQINKVDGGFFKVVTHNGFMGGRYSINANPLNMGGIIWEGGLRLLKRANSSTFWTMDSGSYSGGGSAFSTHTGILNMPFLDADYVISSDSTINFLPIKLAFLNSSFNGSQVQVNWASLSEINADYYQISCSDNVSFSEVNTVKAVGYSQVKRYYTSSFYYSNHERDVFILLEAFDKDGSKSYSKKIRLSKDDRNPQISIVPNPFSNFLSIEQSMAEPIFIQIFNQYGQIIWRDEKTVSNARIETQEFLPGIYYIEANLAGQKFYFKQVKN
ncbi:MAG: T9SS type A sorting domain-containing protein [Bacteroidota bacterium]|nr:T9SS type A sorting domain-containing protein [Bacteroidota bacterium]